MEPTSKPIRVQKYLADLGVCSRRAAEASIRQKSVYINGKLAQLGDHVEPGVDKVTIDGTRVQHKESAKVTIALNKPPGYICSNDDPHNEKTVFELLPKQYAQSRLFCAGRLDKESEGLLILTNDGDLANKLMHPSSLVTKRYQVSLKHPFPKADIPKLIKGVHFEGERMKVEKATFLGRLNKEESKEIDVSMHHGKKREIRILFSKLGYDVKRLKRYQIGKYTIKGMPKGAGILLSKSDIKKLFQNDPTL